MYKNFSPFIDTSSNTTTEKISFISSWAINEVEPLKEYLQVLKDDVEHATSLSHAKTRGELIRQLKQLMDDASKRPFWATIQQAVSKLEEKSQPLPPLGDNKLLALKKIIFVVIDDLLLILSEFFRKS